MIRRLVTWTFLTTGWWLLIGCGVPDVTRVVDVDLDDDVEACSSLRAQGAFQLVLLSFGAIGASSETNIKLQGTQQAVDAAVVEANKGLVSIVTSSSADLLVTVACPNLHRLELIGAVHAKQTTGDYPARYTKIGVYGHSRFTAQKIAALDLDLRGSGNARIAIHGLVADAVEVLLSGESQTVVEGETAELAAELTGTAALAAQELQAQTVKVKSGGDSRTAVLATAHLSANLRDAAYLSYAGTPDLDIKRSDQADIEQTSR
jgi:hypothetical protein